MENIGCAATQGDSYCHVTVNKAGDKVQLYPVNNEKMYIYHLKKKTLTKSEYKIMKDAFKITPNKNPRGGESFETVEFDNGDIGKITWSGNTLNDLYYRVGEKSYKLFKQDDAN